MAMSPRDALHNTRLDLDVETTRRPDCNPTDVLAHLVTDRDDGFDDIAGLEAMHLLLAHQVATREARRRQACPLIAPATHAGDAQRRNIPAVESFDSPDARRIQAVLLGHAQLCAIELSPASASQF
jgi:hypothetical protein